MERSVDKKTRTLLIITMYNILFTNDVAMSYIYKSLELIEQMPMYKGAIKYRANLLHKRMRDYNAKMGKRIKELSYFLADLNDELENTLGLDMMKLENSVRMELQRCHVPNIELMVNLSIAYTMVDATLANCDAVIDSLETNVKFYALPMRKYKLTSVAEAFHQFARLVQKENDKIKNYHCDLRKNTDIENGFLIIISKLKDGEFILKLLEKVDTSDYDE